MSLAPTSAEQVLAAGQLGLQRGQGPGGEVAVEVGDHADGVRQPRAVLERRAALVVDEHERHLVRPVAHRQRGDHRLQQLRLARAGRAGDQGVRPVATQVDSAGAGCGDAEQGRGGAWPISPPPGHVVRRQPRRCQQVEQPGGVGHLGLGLIRGGVAQPCQGAARTGGPSGRRPRRGRRRPPCQHR